MSGHFTLDVNPGELDNAITKLATLHDELGSGGEGGKLGKLTGNHSDWTGQAATACLGEMTTISGTMTGAAPKFETAKDAVKALRDTLDTAKNDTLPKLNQRWDDSETAYDGAVGSANQKYSNTVGPLNHMPPEDVGDARKTANTTRNNAIEAAAKTRAGTQRGINTDYDTMITELKQAAKTCGDAVGAATPFTFTSEQWQAVKGGNLSPAMLAMLRFQVFGPDSLVHHADGLRMGEYVAQQLADDAKKSKPGDPIDPEIVSLLQQFGGDEAFVEGLMTTAGPGGMAWLSDQTRRMREFGSDDDVSQSNALLAALTTVYATGSKVYVDGEYGRKPLMDSDWLDHFNPSQYGAIKDSDIWPAVYEQETVPSGYRPDLLLPFLNQKGISSGLATLVARRALEDYENFKNSDMTDMGAFNRWMLYRGAHFMGPNPVEDQNFWEGKSDDPFKTDLFHIALDRAGDYASSSSAIMLGHRDTMMELMTGSDPQLTGGDGPGHDWISGSLGTILKQATVGQEKYDVVSADGNLWGVADWLKEHPDARMVSNVQAALGDVVTDERFMNGALNSVTSPFGPADGYHDDPTNRQLGPYLNPDLWAALHQEAMRNPGTAAKVIDMFGDYINGTSDSAQHQGYAYNPQTGKYEQAPALSSLDYYQAEAARNFLGTNLNADLGDIQQQLEDALEKNHQDKAMAKDILGTMVGWAQDPTSIKDDIIGKVTDFAVDQVVDWTMPSDADVQAKYDGAINSLHHSLENPIVSPTMWTDMENSSDQLVRDISSGTGPTSVQAGTAGYTDITSQNQTYTGNPQQYVGHDSTYVGNGQVITDDFLTYGQDGKPNGIVPISQMNQLQQRAYMNWLQDPAVQQYMDGQIDAVHTARENATHK